MGFLSKLFGGDAGPVPGKPQDEAAASSSAASPSAAASPEASPPDTAEAPKTVPRPPEAPREAAPPPRAAASPGAARAEPFPAPPKSASTAALRVPVETPAAPTAPAARVEAPETPRPAGRPTLRNTERQAAPVPREPPPVAAREPGPVTSGVPRRPPDAPRRPPQVESSIITSAPELAAPPAAAAAPRPAAGARPAKAAALEPPRAPAAAADPNPPPRAAMASVSGEAGLLGASRTRKDRTKSPGFYSNMAPAYGSQTVSPGAAPSTLKRTVVGVAPPPEPAPIAVADATAKAPAPAASAAQSPIAADVNGAAAAAELAPAAAAEPLPTAAANDVVPGAESMAPAQTANDNDELEKEETAPGVGHMPSRHDPVIRGELPERDLELLVQFVMDVGLGFASDAWLGAARGAIGRLKAGATRLARAPLDKALTQFQVELDAPNALSEERRGRIMQQLVLVDLALPRPIDVSGQRSIRERLIVQHLISELAATHPLVAQHLREAGSVSLERLSRLVPAELAERVGLSSEQVEQALAPFREYLDERGRRGPEAALLGKGALLAQRLAELEASAEQFERVADGDDAQAKREARRRRQSDIARVSLFLAEWGEAGLLGEFERSSVQGKITRLRRWLSELPAS